MNDIDDEVDLAARFAESAYMMLENGNKPWENFLSLREIIKGIPNDHP